MSTLTADKVRDYELGGINEYPVIAGDVIYEGAAVGDNGSGYARPLEGGDPFRGFAERCADNSDGSAGDASVRVKEAGKVVLPISGLAITDVGKDVYASDDDNFTLTPGSNTRIGYVSRYISSGVGLVSFSANEGIEAELTAASGTAGDTVADVGESFSQTTINNNFASLAAKVNYLLRRLGQ